MARINGQVMAGPKPENQTSVTSSGIRFTHGEYSNVFSSLFTVETSFSECLEASLNSFVQIGTSFAESECLEAFSKVSVAASESGKPGNVSLSAALNGLSTNGNFQSYLDKFARFFGENFRQDTTKIYISKANLPDLTPKQNNRAESLLAALLLQALLRASNSIASNIHLEVLSTGIMKKNGSKYQTLTLRVHLFSLLEYDFSEVINADEPITPDNIIS